MDSQHRVDKTARLVRKNGGMGSARDTQMKLSKLQRSLTGEETSRMHMQPVQAPPHVQQLPRVPSYSDKNHPIAGPAPIVTVTIGRDGRLFAAHEDVLRQAPFFEKILRTGYFDAQSKRIALPDEEPEVFSAVLEYLYKGDYYPRLLHNKQRDSWQLEDSHPPSSSRRATPHSSAAMTHNSNSHSPHIGGGRAGPASPNPAAVEATVFLSSIEQHILRDTVTYCAADRYGLEELKRLSLRKQGLQSGIDVATILRSAQYCYAHTPDSDSRLRAHYLALIIRCRKTFKRSGTMQAEMEKGGNNVYGEGSGKLFFDLFVAMCNHLDDVIDASNARTPKTV